MMSGMIPRSLAAALTLVLAGVATSPPASGAPARPIIVTGVTQWAAIAAVVAGPDARVVSLLADPNADPHEHEATVHDAAWVARAAIVIENGAGYDTWFTKLVDGSSRGATVVDAAHLARTRAGANPHLFYSVVVARRVVGAVVAALARHGVTAGVATRAASLLAALDGTSRSLARVRASCGGVAVAATEDVAGYLLGDAGLRVVTPARFRLAVGNGVDPTVRDLATALAQVRRHPAFVLDNRQTRNPLTEELVRVARAEGVPVVEVTETMRGGHYAAWLDGVVRSVRAALRHQGCLA